MFKHGTQHKSYVLTELNSKNVTTNNPEHKALNLFYFSDIIFVWNTSAFILDLYHRQSGLDRPA